MQLYCDQERLATALKAVLPAVPSRPLSPADAGVLLNADLPAPACAAGRQAGGRLELAATDREVAIRYQVGAQVTRPGSVVLPARTMADLAPLLDADRVTMELDEEGCTIALHCGRTLAHVRGWKVEEFPALPTPAGEPVARLEAQALRDGIGRVAYAACLADRQAGTDATRAVLGCVLVQLDAGRVTLVAADGFRLALYSAPFEAPVTGVQLTSASSVEPNAPLVLAVPAKGLRELQKLVREDEVAVLLDESRKYAIFETGDVTVGCLLGGQFPDYRQVIPQEWGVRAVVGRAVLLQACRTARALHDEKGGALSVEFTEGRLVVSSASLESGEGRTELEAEVEGLPAQAGGRADTSLNARYLADAVAATEGEQVAITAGTPGEGSPQPVTVRPACLPAAQAGADRPVAGAVEQVAVIMPLGR